MPGVYGICPYNIIFVLLLLFLLLLLLLLYCWCYCYCIYGYIFICICIYVQPVRSPGKIQAAVVCRLTMYASYNGIIMNCVLSSKRSHCNVHLFILSLTSSETSLLLYFCGARAGVRLVNTLLHIAWSWIVFGWN